MDPSDTSRISVIKGHGDKKHLSTKISAVTEVYTSNTTKVSLLLNFGDNYYCDKPVTEVTSGSIISC